MNDDHTDDLGACPLRKLDYGAHWPKRRITQAIAKYRDRHESKEGTP